MRGGGLEEGGYGGGDIIMIVPAKKEHGMEEQQLQLSNWQVMVLN